MISKRYLKDLPKFLFNNNGSPQAIVHLDKCPRGHLPHKQLPTWKPMSKHLKKSILFSLAYLRGGATISIREYKLRNRVFIVGFLFRTPAGSSDPLDPFW